MGFTCSAGRPWGIHPIVRNDQDCPRCGWTAPGPIGDARADLEAMHDALAAAAERGWVVHDAGPAADAGAAAAKAYFDRLDAARLNGLA
jgi:hypothetical protein